MKIDSDHFKLDTPDLSLSAQLVPWDQKVFGFPVAQIITIKVGDYAVASAAYACLANWLQEKEVRLVSCRLPHTGLHESFFLESTGFRFVEMVLHPQKKLLQPTQAMTNGKGMEIIPAQEKDLSTLQEIAQHAFRYERYHADPRIDVRLAGKRYANWVQNAIAHPTQHLLKIMKSNRLLGFFIVESIKPKSMYWHLTAIAPQWQGMGYGWRVWNAMLDYHRELEFDAVQTTISARNIEVLNLYSKLQFRFTPPEMTFHWYRTEL